MDVITDIKWIYPHGEPTEEELKLMEEKERLRLEEIERLKLEKEQQLLDKRLEIEERNVRQMMSNDRRKMLAAERKKRKQAEKKAEKAQREAEREARKHVNYPKLDDYLQTVVYKLRTSFKAGRFFMFKHDALFHAIKELQDGNEVQITEHQITPSKESSYEQENIDIHDECPFCNKHNQDNTNRSEAIEKYQAMLKQNDEIKANNRNLINEYVEQLDAKTEEILKEKEAVDE